MFPISFSFEITKAIEFLSNFVEKFGKNEIIEIEEKELYNLSEVYSVFKKYREERVVKENPELKEAFEKMENFFREYIPGWERERKSYILMRKSSTTFQNIISDFLKFKKEKSKELTFISSLDTGIEYEEFKEKPTEIEKDIVEAVSKLPGDIRTKYFSLVTLSSRDEKTEYKIRINDKIMQIRDFSYIWYKNKRGRRMYRFFEGLM